jgi:hypothetical protein
MKLFTLINKLNETNSKDHVGKDLFDSFPFQMVLKHGDALGPPLSNFVLEYAIKIIQENQVGLKVNGTHHLLAYADYVNLLEDNIDTINKNTEILTDASNNVCMEVNIEKAKYMLLSCHQNAVQNHDTNTAVTNQNLIREEIKTRLNSGNACYQSVQNLLSSHLLLKT